MAIYERGRDFQKILEEIEVGVIPLKFIQDITCILNDGTKVILGEDDFSQGQSNFDDIEHLLKDLEFYNSLSDLKIRIDYDRVEEDVDIEVSRLFQDRD